MEHARIADVEMEGRGAAIAQPGFRDTCVCGVEGCTVQLLVLSSFSHLPLCGRTVTDRGGLGTGGIDQRDGGASRV